MAQLPTQPVGLFTHLWGEQLDLFLIALTVILFYLAFPSGGYGYLSWFAIVPVLLVIPRSGAKQSFYLGFLAALFGWMASIWWSVDGIAMVSQSHASLVLPVVFVFCLISAIPYGIATWLCNRYQWLSSLSGALKFTAVLTLLINFTPHVLPGNLAHSLYLSPKSIQLAAIGGVPLVFFVIHAVNIYIALALLKIRKNKALSLKAIGIALLFFSVNLLFGYLVLDINKDGTQGLEDSQQFTVGYVQPNLSTELRSRGDWPVLKKSVDQLMPTFNVDAIKPIDLIVLPEISIPVSYQHFGIDEQAINEWSKIAGILYAGLGFEEEIQQITAQTYFNSVGYVSQQTLVAEYDKQRLLPFTEYLPFEQYLPWLRQVFPNTPKYQAGSKLPILTINENNKSVKIVPLICYEGLFTELVAKGVDAGGQIFINVVNDAWFGTTSGRDVHFALTLFRTVEYRKPLLRVTNNGISGLINPYGEIIKESMLPTDTATAGVVSVALVKQTSFYARYPYFFAVICILLVLLPLRRKINE